jgi:hypothetical protein
VPELLPTKRPEPERLRIINHKGFFEFILEDKNGNVLSKDEDEEFPKSGLFKGRQFSLVGPPEPGKKIIIK